MTVRLEDDRKGIVIGNAKTIEKARQRIFRALGLDEEGRPPKKKPKEPTLTPPKNEPKIVGGP